MCRRFATERGDALTSQVSAVRATVARANVASCIFTSSPLAAALTKPILQFYFTICAVFYLAHIGNAVYNYCTVGRFDEHATQYRFTAISFRAGPADRAGWGGGGAQLQLAELGLLRDGCPVYAAGDGELLPGPTADSVVMRLARPYLANGWFFTAAAGAAAEPVRFVLEGSRDGETWAMVGAAGAVMGESGVLNLVPGYDLTPPWRAPHNVSDRRVFDPRPTPAWLMSFMTPLAVAAVGIFAAVGVARCSTTAGISKKFSVTFFLMAAIYTASGVGWAAAGPPTAWVGAANLLRGGGVVVVGFAFFYERYLVRIAMPVCLSGMVMEILALRFLEGGRTEPWPMMRMFLMAPLLQAFLGCGTVVALMLLVRWRILVWAWELLEPDRVTYTELWSRVLARPGSVEALHRLADVAEPFRSAPQPHQRALPVDAADDPRQLGTAPAITASPFFRNPSTAKSYTTAPPAGFAMTFSRTVSQGTMEFGRTLTSGAVALLRGTEATAVPVRCLDQLMTQAAGVHLLLVELCQQWALLSRGCFYCAAADGEHGEGEYRRWEDLVHDAAARKRVKWAALKKPARCLEKLVRSYGLDVSQLVDICRQTIVFECPDDLCDALLAIIADPDVIVERVKNRMLPPSASSQASGPAAAAAAAQAAALQATGYRDVSLNLRVRSPTALGLGLDWHVCEVQLLLLDFAQFKRHEGHARYVQWRNWRAE